MLVVTVLFLGIGIPIQLGMTQNSLELVCFSLDAIAKRDNDNLANELFEQRYAAIQLRLQEIVLVDKVVSVAIYDRSGNQLKAISTISPPPSSLNIPLKDSNKYTTEDSPQGLTFIKPIRAVGETLGWIRIVYDMSSIHQQTVIYYVFFGGLLALSLCCMFVILRWRIKQLIIDPLNLLVSAMKNTEASERMPPVDIYRPASELASLFETYNDRSERLHLSYAELNNKKAELEESEARFRTIVNQAPVGIILFDNNGTITTANEYFADIMGAPSPNHVVGINMLNDVADEGVVNCVDTAIKKDNSYYENYYTSLSGNKKVYIRVRLLRINTELLCGVFEDLTEHNNTLKSLSESEENLAALNRDLESTVKIRTKALTDQANELKKANARLKELDTLKTAFLSSVSHELRTPLTSILGFAKVTLKQFKKHIAPLIADSPRIANKGQIIETNLSIVSREGERLSRLVNDVLDMARIESGRMPWNDKQISPSTILNNVVSASAGDFQDPKVILLAEIQSDIPLITIDPDKLFQVVRNLLHNAGKFTERGNVTVYAKHHAAENEIEISVKDTGPGIRKSEISSVFEKFHQIESESDGKAKPKGSGLGLAICQQIIEHYNGRIWVESEEGTGSCFIIRLPILEEPANLESQSKIDNELL
jgi:PAS domain S-box-containing protein